MSGVAVVRRDAEPLRGVCTGYYVGLDLGQARDFSVVTVTERIEVEREQAGFDLRSSRPLIFHNLLFLHRFALQTPYPSVAAEVASLIDTLPWQNDNPRLLVDATGVGKPVLDILRDIGLRPVGVSITNGVDAVTHSSTDLRVPKRSLIGQLQVVLQTRRIKFAAQMRGLSVLIRELEGFTLRISSSGTETMEAWSDADVHDDAVLSLALAIWGAEHRYQPPKMHFL